MSTQGSITGPTVGRRSDDLGSVTRLIRRLGSDDTDDRNEAARLIWQRYFHALLALARDHLRPRIRAGKTRRTCFRTCTPAFAGGKGAASSTW